MITYEDLLIESENNNLITKEKNLPISKGRIKGNRIAINKELSETEKKCILAEELGHHYTAVGEILNQSSIANRKQEMRGRILAYNRLIGLMGIIKAYNHNCKSISESAEYLDVTEKFLKDAIIYYKNKYGTQASIGNYIITFEPTITVTERKTD